MTIAVGVHGATGRGVGSATTIVTTLSGTPTAGNYLIAFSDSELTITNKHTVWPSGWTQLYHVDSAVTGYSNCHKVMVAGPYVNDGTITGSGADSDKLTLTFADGTGAVAVAAVDVAVVEVSGVYASAVKYEDFSDHGNPHTFPTISPPSGIEAGIVALTANHNPYGVTAYPTTYTLLDEFAAGGDARVMSFFRHEASTAGVYFDSYNLGGGAKDFLVQAYFTELAPLPFADFVGNPNTGTVPLSVAFTDLSGGGTVTAWAWDFGDGGTSTSQNPTHVYTLAGTYTITLVATIDGSPYTATRTAYIQVLQDVGYIPPTPGGAIIEIYAAEAGSARWDEATWDDALWSTAGWQNVTPESVRATIKWGSSQPELGILSQPDAGSWSIDVYDPLRILDPANVDSPYFGDLQPYLPVRVSHRGVVIRQGYAESIGHSFIHPGLNGYFRVTDNQSLLANAMVPHDTTLANTLYARARAAISAAGITCEVLPDPASGDPAVVAWADTGNDQSVWAWIADAAQQVLHVPYIDRLNRLGFRDYTDPLYRGRELGDPELIDLQSIVQYNGLYSRVDVMDGAGVLSLSRALTPPPRYGVRTFARDNPTPDDAVWAEAVLQDRAVAALRWVPGQLYPLTADSVERLATIEAVELVAIVNANTDPVVDVAGIVVGGEIQITAKAGDEAKWWFTFEAAQTPELPLIVSGTETEFLFRTGSDVDYLYPS